MSLTGRDLAGGQIETSDHVPCVAAVEQQRFVFVAGFRYADALRQRVRLRQLAVPEQPQICGFDDLGIRGSLDHPKGYAVFRWEQLQPTQPRKAVDRGGYPARVRDGDCLQGGWVVT